jgi:NADH dehydrogenase (ubiquinone) 1 alpha subcomplex subunit 6
MVSMYILDTPPSQIRQSIRERFERNRHVDDIKVIDRLIHQSRSAYQEAMNGWLPSTMAREVLIVSRGKQQKSFLQKFYEGEWSLLSCSSYHEVILFEGRDGEQVLAAPQDLR